MEKRRQLEEVCRRLTVDAVYLFGSRADDGLRMMAGEAVEAGGSDLDVGIRLGTNATATALANIQVAFEDVFAPLRIDLVPLDRVDALFQFRAIDGHRVFAADAHAADLFELIVMRRAAELLPMQREIERSRFGVSTS